MNSLTNQIEQIRSELTGQFEAHRSLAKFKPSDSQSIATTIDHTNLKAQATSKDIQKLCEEAIQHQFFSVCIHPVFVLEAGKQLQNTNVKVVTVVGFPLGANTTETKVFETVDAIDNGAQEIDMVLSIGKLKANRLDEVYQDIQTIVQQAGEIPVKVILETCALTHEEKIKACILSQLSGATFVKTSTGFGESGATVEDIQLMKKIVGTTMGVKASGGIKSFESAKKMLGAGADRLGTSNSVSIIKESL